MDTIWHQFCTEKYENVGKKQFLASVKLIDLCLTSETMHIDRNLKKVLGGHADREFSRKGSDLCIKKLGKKCGKVRFNWLTGRQST